MTPIDLDKIKEAAEKSRSLASTWSNPPSIIVPADAADALVAVVEAALTYVADHGKDVMEPECFCCKGLLGALHPFSHINGEQP